MRMTVQEMKLEDPIILLQVLVLTLVEVRVERVVVILMVAKEEEVGFRVCSCQKRIKRMLQKWENH